MQGHVGYPHLADNPIPRLLDILTLLKTRRLDAGNVHFEPSNLEITTVDVGNPANNVIPASARAVLNIRYSTEQTRSEERRVGKECVSTCRSRWSPYP